MSDDAKVSLGKGSVPIAQDAPGSAARAVSAGKGRPTPKRSERERRRGGPVAPPPATRKEAAKRMREQTAADRTAGRAPAPDRMLPRDAGPVRALVRDVVDARVNLAVFMLPIALLLVLSQLSGNDQVYAVLLRVWTFVLLAVIVDLLLAGAQVRSRVRAAYPQEKRVLRHVAYGLLRTTVFRRLRTPKPRVAPPRLRLPRRR